MPDSVVLAGVIAGVVEYGQYEYDHLLQNSSRSWHLPIEEQTNIADGAVSSIDCEK